MKEGPEQIQEELKRLCNNIREEICKYKAKSFNADEADLWEDLDSVMLSLYNFVTKEIR